MTATELNQEQIIRILSQHPLTKHLLRAEEERDELRKKRIQAAQQLNGLRRELEESLLILAEEETRKKMAFDEAKAVMELRRSELSEAIRMMITERGRIETEIGTRETFLKRTAPPTIAARIAKLQEEREGLIEAYRHNPPGMKQKQMMWGYKTVRDEGEEERRESFHKRLAEIDAAIEEAKASVFDPTMEV